MNLPNALTLFRFALIPVYLWAFYGTASEHKVAAWCVLLLAGLTDVLDGYLARKRGQTTLTGQLLDPLADKSMMLAVLFSLLQSGRVPWLVAGLLVLRDAGMIVGAAYFHLRGKRAVPKANRWGKATTCCYYLTISAVMLAWPGPRVELGLLWFTVVLSYVTTWIYAAGMDLIEAPRRVL